MKQVWRIFNYSRPGGGKGGACKTMIGCFKNKPSGRLWAGFSTKSPGNSRLSAPRLHHSMQYAALQPVQGVLCCIIWLFLFQTKMITVWSCPHVRFGGILKWAEMMTAVSLESVVQEVQWGGARVMALPSSRPPRHTRWSSEVSKYREILFKL